LVAKGGMGAVVASTIERWFTPTFLESHPTQVNEVRDMICSTRPLAYVQCAASLVNLSQTHLLSRIEVPTLVLTGRHDVAATPAIAQEIATHVPAAQLAVIEEAAHLSNIEQPDAFSQRVLEFLAHVAPSNPRESISESDDSLKIS